MTCASLTWPGGRAPLGSQSLWASAMCCSRILATQKYKCQATRLYFISPAAVPELLRKRASQPACHHIEGHEIMASLSARSLKACSLLWNAHQTVLRRGRNTCRRSIRWHSDNLNNWPTTIPMSPSFGRGNTPTIKLATDQSIGCVLPSWI